MSKNILLIFSLLNVAAYATDMHPIAKKGLLDIRGFDFKNEKSIKLDGEWLYYPDHLLNPIECKDQDNVASFPHLWEEAQGVATYRLTILLPKSQIDDRYVIELPQMYSAYTLWVNGREAARNGEVGTNRASNKPQWLPKLIQVKNAQDSVSLVLQVANFNHAYGGLKNSLVLGMADQLVAKRSLAEVVNRALLGILSVSGIAFLVVYFFLKKEKSVLYFAVMCLVWAARSIFSELYMAIQWMPNLDWELGVKIEYLTIFLEAIFAMLFISKLYPLDTSKVVRNILVFPNYLFVFITMATPAIFYTRFLNIYLGAASLVIVYAVFIIIRAILYERYGAKFAVLGIITGICAFGYNMLSYFSFFDFNPLLYHSFYVVTFTCIAIALTFQLSSKAVKMNIPDKLLFDDFMNPSVKKGDS